MEYSAQYSVVKGIRIAETLSAKYAKQAELDLVDLSVNGIRNPINWLEKPYAVIGDRPRLAFRICSLADIEFKKIAITVPRSPTGSSG
jgi:hypothetical protein